jgi:hypothetical protein
LDGDHPFPSRVKNILYTSGRGGQRRESGALLTWVAAA